MKAAALLLLALAATASAFPTFVAKLTPTAGCTTCSGTVLLTNTTAGISVEVSLSGMPASRTLGVHLHQFGDLASTDGSAAGGHYNPEGLSHACTGPRHAGDLGNIEIGADGTGSKMFVSQGASLDANSTSYILGRMIVVHSAADDCVTQPTGNAGSRLLTGVIGIKSSSEEPANVTPPAVTSDLLSAVAILRGANVNGQVTFKETSDGATLTATVFLSGLGANERCSVYVLAAGDISDLSNAAIFDPTSASPACTSIHGFLGNFVASADGIVYSASVAIPDGALLLKRSSAYIVGRGVGVFGSDDCTTVPDGNRGSTPFAAGVIGIRGSAAIPDAHSIARLRPAAGTSFAAGAYATVESHRVFNNGRPSAVHVLNIPTGTFTADTTLSVHIHTLGDMTDGRAAHLGSVFNPTDAPHGCGSSGEAGGLGNVQYTATTGANAVMFSPLSSLDASSSGFIIGRGVSLSSHVDSCDASYNVGNILMAGVVGYAFESPLATTVVSPPIVTDYEATCVLEDINSSNVRGTIRLTPSDAGVHVSVSARDFVASSIHGFHVHAFGDVSDTAGGSKTGGHFNPSNTAHGCDPEVRHAGDLGNIEASTGGVVNANVTTHLLTLSPTGKSSALGHGFIIHSNPDDCTTQPTGNAGSRMAQCVVGFSKVPGLTPPPTVPPSVTPTPTGSGASYAGVAPLVVAAAAIVAVAAAFTA